MNLFLMSQSPPSADLKPVTIDGLSTGAGTTDDELASDENLVFTKLIEAQTLPALSREKGDVGFPVAGATDQDLPPVEEQEVDLVAVESETRREVKTAKDGVAPELPRNGLQQSTPNLSKPRPIPEEPAVVGKFDAPVMPRTFGRRGEEAVALRSLQDAVVVRQQSPAQTVVQGQLTAQQAAAGTDLTDVGAKRIDALTEVRPAKAVLPAQAAVLTGPIAMQNQNFGQDPAVVLPAASVKQDLNVGREKDQNPRSLLPSEKIIATTNSVVVGVGVENAANASQLSQSAVQKFPQVQDPRQVALEQEIAPLLPTSDRTAVASTTMAAQPFAGADTTRQIAHQIAHAVTNGNHKATEIALNPEELGRVRLNLSAGDGAVTLVILADRPETQELMRRHIDVLAQEFRDLGYESITFSFNAEGESGNAAANEDSTNADDDITNTIHDEEARTDIAQTSGLDLRL